MVVATNLQYLAGLATSAATIWFTFWGVRKKYELDYPLNRTGHLIRLTFVGLGFFAALARAPQFKTVRLLGGLFYLSFLCWPNLAYHLSRLFGKSSDSMTDSNQTT